MAGDRRAWMAAVDDEVMALGFRPIASSTAV
jgi:hypothetical protein